LEATRYTPRPITKESQELAPENSETLFREEEKKKSGSLNPLYSTKGKGEEQQRGRRHSPRRSNAKRRDFQLTGRRRRQREGPGFGRRRGVPHNVFLRRRRLGSRRCERNGVFVSLLSPPITLFFSPSLLSAAMCKVAILVQGYCRFRRSPFLLPSSFLTSLYFMSLLRSGV
jgi:hypothetical protein